MAFPTISGRLYDSMKLMGLNMKWQQRQSASFRAKEKEENPERARMREDLDNMRKSSILSSINSKLNAGAELTDEELAYLKKNNPKLYQEALEIKREREAYEKALKKCKTKDEVERLNANQMQRFLSQAKTISANPNIPEGEKKAQLEKILKRVMGIQNEHLKFVSSKEYADLPREYEEKKKKKQGEESQPALEKKELVPEDFKKVKDLLEEAMHPTDKKGATEPEAETGTAQKAPASHSASPQKAEDGASPSAAAKGQPAQQGTPSLSIRV